MVSFHRLIVIGQRITALTAWPLRVGGVNRDAAAMRRAPTTNSSWVVEITRRTDTAPRGLSSTSNTTVPVVIPCLASDAGNAADPWRNNRGVASSSPTEYVSRSGGGGGDGRGGVGRTCGGSALWGGAGGVGSGAGGRSEKNVSTGIVTSMGISARGIGTREGSGMSLNSAITGVGGGSGGGASGGGGGGGGSSGSSVSISRIIKSGTPTCPTISRDSASTQISVPAAAMPMRMERMRMSCRMPTPYAHSARLAKPMDHP